MNIALVSPYFHPHIGGVESRVLNTARHLVRRNHSVTVFTSLLPNTEEMESYEGIEIKRVKPALIFYKTPITPKLNRMIRDYDVVDAHSPPPIHSYYAACACKAHKLPFVLTYHCDLEIPSLLGKIIVGIYNKTLGYYTMKNSDKIIVTTASYAATSRALWKYDTTVIPTGVDTNTFKQDDKKRNAIRDKYNMEKDDCVVLFVGRLVAHKGLEYLIRSAKYTNAKYIIVGSGELKEKLESMGKKENLQNRIIFTGNVDDESLPGYYNASDIFVLPSVARLEAMGLVVLEAMACSKAVIVSDLPGVRELVTDRKDGLCVEAMNEKLLGEKINYLQSNPEMRRSFGETGRRKIRSEFSWEKIIEKIENVYHEVRKRN